MWMETIKESLPAEFEICVRHHHRELHVHTDGKNFLSKINELQMQVGDLSQIWIASGKYVILTNI